MRKVAFIVVVAALFAVFKLRTALAQTEDAGSPSTVDAGPAPAPISANAGAAATATVNVVTVVRSVELSVCLPSSMKAVPDSEKTRLPADLIKDCKDGGGLIESQTRSEIQPRVRNNNYVVVYVGDGSTTLGAAQITNVNWSIHKEGAKGAVPMACEDTGNAWDERYFKLCKIEGDRFPDASHNDVVEVDVAAGGAAVPRYGRFTRRWSLASTAAGFWIPVGLFGTNFQSNDDGITLAALPVGLAWGFQLNLPKGEHIGLSFYGSWSIAPQKTDGKANGNYTLASLSPGAFLDFDGYAYAGYGYALDLRSGHSNPGHMMVVGIGPKLLQLLKGQP